MKKISLLTGGLLSLSLLFSHSIFAEEIKKYRDQEIEYFKDIAFGSEFGDGMNYVCKWINHVIIKVEGRPSNEDMETLLNVTKELSELTGLEVRLAHEGEEPNVTIHFDSLSKFPSLLSNYVSGNWGFTSYLPNYRGEIKNAAILIDITKTWQAARNHLIREELTQSFGLARDSYQYPNSIFYQPWTTVQHYDPIDKQVIRMLYEPQIKPGMTMKEASNILVNRKQGPIPIQIQAKQESLTLREGEEVNIKELFSVQEEDVELSLKSDSDFITINEKGILHALKEGQSTIIATPLDLRYEGKQTIKVEVKKAISNLSFKIGEKKIKYNDTEMADLDQEAILYKGKTMVPFRVLLEIIGAEVEWDENSRLIKAKKGDNDFSVAIDQIEAGVNGNGVTLDVPPILVNGRVLVPLRFAVESLGGKVEWDAKTLTARIHLK